jgi:hypothetical protein
VLANLDANHMIYSPLFENEDGIKEMSNSNNNYAQSLVTYLSVIRSQIVSYS